MDKLEEIFKKQNEFMELLRENDRLPEYPVDLTTKPGQRMIKEMIYNTIEELMEASMTLRNKIHRLSDDRRVDLDHYKEELGDALAFFVEVCITSGITPDELFNEYARKNQIVKDRLLNGY